MAGSPSPGALAPHPTSARPAAPAAEGLGCSVADSPVSLCAPSTHIPDAPAVCPALGRPAPHKADSTCGPSACCPRWAPDRGTHTGSHFPQSGGGLRDGALAPRDGAHPA
ncbi:hypothetical protein VULLAG_LOCUS4116 [Vulpes lagopus]